MRNLKPGRQREPSQQVSLTVKLEDIWTIFIGDKERSGGSNSDSFRIKPKRRKVITSYKGSCRSNKNLVDFVSKKPCIQQHCANVWERSAQVSSGAQNMK